MLVQKNIIPKCTRNVPAMYPHLLPDTGEQQKTLTETKNAASEHITRFARLLRGINGNSRTRWWWVDWDSNPGPPD